MNDRGQPEKHNIGGPPGNIMTPRLAVSMAEAARAHAWEGSVYRELLRHGVLTEQS